MARSRAYPGVDLEEAVEGIRIVRRALGPGKYDRAAISKAWGIAEATAIRRVAAMVHFGLLDRSSDGYSISALGRILADPLPDELETALRQAIRHPTLYAELLAQYEPEGQIPERLATILHRHHQITDNAAELAADVFIRSAKYAGIVDDNLRFTQPNEDKAPTSPGTINSGLCTAPGNEKPQQQNSIDSVIEGQDFNFRLSSGKFARLSVPAELTAKDISIIKKQIELLELQLDSFN